MVSILSGFSVVAKYNKTPHDFYGVTPTTSTSKANVV